MKPKSLYILLAVLITAISVSLLLTRETIKTQPLSQEFKLQETGIGPSAAAMIQAQQPYIPIEKRGAITIIKPVSEEVARQKEVEKERASRVETAPTPTSSSGNGSSASDSRTTSSPEKTTSGITKIENRPSENETKEMNARGIVLW